MKKMILVILLGMIMMLSSCSTDEGHNKYNNLKVGSYYVYYNKPGTYVDCVMMAGPIEFVSYGKEVYLYDEYFGNCARTVYILINDDVISLTEAVEANLISRNDIDNVDWGFDIYPTINLFETPYKQINFLDNNMEVFFTFKSQDVLDFALDNMNIQDRFIVGYTSEEGTIEGYIELIDFDSVKTTITVVSSSLYIESSNSFNWPYVQSKLHNKFIEEIPNT